MRTLDKAKLCLKIIKERKAINPLLLEVAALTSIADYFLIASGNSSRQVQAMTQHLQKKMGENGFKAYGIEGGQEWHWVLVDFRDVVVHLFYHPFRDVYDLEGLWFEARRVDIEEEENRC